MNEKQADQLAEEFAKHQLKEFILYPRREAFEELEDRLAGAFLMGYHAGHKAGKSTEVLRKQAEATVDDK